MQAIIPPNAKDPVSPIKIFAGLLFTHKNASTPPTTQTPKTIKFLYSIITFCPTPKLVCTPHKRNIITHSADKPTTLTPPAKPSKPSVRFALFVTAKNTSILTGIIPQPISMLLKPNGKYKDVPIILDL